MTGRRAASTNGTTRVAALYESAGSIAVVIVEAHGRPSVVLARETDSAATVERLLADHGVSRVVRVLPSSKTLLRVAKAPEADDEEMIATLGLIAEGEFSDRLPAHRRGVGVLPGRSEAGERRALLTAWPDGGDRPEPIGNLDERWVAEIAALARIRGVSRQPAWSLDAGRGSVSVLAERNGHISCRAVQAEHDSAAAWAASARTIIEETTRAVGGSGPSIELGDGPRAIRLEPEAARELRSRVSGVPDDSAWMDRFGLALGAALVEVDEDPLIRSFASLRAEPRREDAPALARLGTWLSVPSNAAIVVVASVVVAVLAPLGFAKARLVILETKVAGIEQAEAQRAALETRAAMYDQLDRERLPMTKLLADIAGAAPVIAPDLVLVDLVRLTSDRELYLEGVADTPELVSVFQKNLNESGLFQGVTVTRSEASADGVDFTLTARVVQNPYRSVKRTEETDFIARSTAARLYGEEAVARAGGASSLGAASNGRSGGDAPEARRERPTRPGGGEDEEESTRGRPARVEIPEPLSEEALLAMSRAEVMMGFATRRKVVQSNPDLEPEIKQRLEEEIERMLARNEELKGGG